MTRSEVPSDARDEELASLLSALLDGELSPAEQAEVRAFVERSPEAQHELEQVARVRSLVRDLPDVDPPFGFYERMLRPRRTRRVAPKLGAALVAAAAAFVFIVGLTPVSDQVVPPVNAYAERHLSMVKPAVAVPDSTAAQDPATTETVDSRLATPSPVGSTGTATASTITASTAGPGPASVGSATSIVSPSASASAGADGFEEVPPGELDQIGVPASLADGYTRTAGYRRGGGALHLVYAKDRMVVSVYEQTGSVAWQSLPSSGVRLTVGSMPAWQMSSGDEEVMVVERDTTIYTVVALKGHQEMVAVVEAMPPSPAPSLWDRTHQACRTVVNHFGFDE